jgi:hypothetical protein
MADRSAHPRDKPVQHLLLPRLLKIDHQLVAFDGGNIVVVEFLAEGAIADGKGGVECGEGLSPPGDCPFAPTAAD